MTYKKKLIEVSIPLEEINEAAAKEKSIRHGHPSTLHLWWARRPLAAARAVLFASMVDDPSEHPETFDTEEKVLAERKRLHDLICQLVQWENVNNEDLLNEARKEIRKSCGDNIPTVWDPFCGGGTIPLEAQRLGLPAVGSDLNPVAVMITKAMIEIPPLFADMPPVNPDDRSHGTEGYKGAAGLAADLRYYSDWMRNEAEKSIGFLYPKADYDGRKLPVIAWIYARTVKCPNPTCGKEMPLVRSFILCNKPKKHVYINPKIADGKIIYHVYSETDSHKPSEKFEIPRLAEEGTVGRNGAVCLHCGTSVSLEYVRKESHDGRLGNKLIAIAADGGQGYGRVYIEPNSEHEALSNIKMPEEYPTGELADWPGHINVYKYGFTKLHQLFTPRQLTAMIVFSDLVSEVIEKVHRDARSIGLVEGALLKDDGTGAMAYGQAIGVYLSFVIDKMSDLGNALTRWEPIAQCPRQLFGRQAIPMVWDYTVANVFSNSSGSFSTLVEGIVKSLPTLVWDKRVPKANAYQRDATLPIEGNWHVFSTDPPYYDNIGYADLSDFFYIWMRRSIKNVYPDLFRTMLVPKTEELVAIPHRFGGSSNLAQAFFEDGLYRTFHNIKNGCEKRFPVTIYYAYKQREDEGKQATGWETMLQGVISAGFKIVGTWPLRTENSSRLIGQNSNALASSIALVCRPREDDAPVCTRRDLFRELSHELPISIEKLQQAGIAPVDMAQSSIGPGMAIYSKYAQVLESDGTPMKVSAALALINETISTLRTTQSVKMGPSTSFCVDWFEQFGYGVGSYGYAEPMSKGHNIVIAQLESLDIFTAQKGKARLIKPEDLPEPSKEDFIGHKGYTAWWSVMQMAKALEAGGEEALAKLMMMFSPEVLESAKSLCYCLYDICDRKKRSTDGRIFNELITCWEGVGSEAVRLNQSGNAEQLSLFD